MRTTGMAILAAAILATGLGTLVSAPASAGLDTVPPFKGNDTGGIIAYSLYQRAWTSRRSRSITARDTAKPSN